MAIQATRGWGAVEFERELFVPVARLGFAGQEHVDAGAAGRVRWRRRLELAAARWRRMFGS